MGIENELKIICNSGDLEIVKITEDMYDEVLEFHKNNFLKNENVSIACEIFQTKLAIKESLDLVKISLKDGLSFAVRHSETKEIVAIRINSISHPATDNNKLKFPIRSAGVICAQNFVRRMKSSFDIFKEWKIDCAFELSYTSTHSDFSGFGLATTLTEFSIELAHQLANGTFEEKEMLPPRIRDLKPKAIISIYTSLYTQKLGVKLGMQTLEKIPFTQFFYEGKSFAEKIEPIHKYSTFVAKSI